MTTRTLSATDVMVLAAASWKLMKRAYLRDLLALTGQDGDAPAPTTVCDVPVWRTALPEDLPGAVLWVDWDDSVAAVVHRDWPDFVSLPLGAPLSQILRVGATITPGDEIRWLIDVAAVPDLDTELLRLAETAHRRGLIHADSVASIRARLDLPLPVVGPQPSPWSTAEAAAAQSALPRLTDSTPEPASCPIPGAHACSSTG